MCVCIYIYTKRDTVRVRFFALFTHCQARTPEYTTRRPRNPKTHKPNPTNQKTKNTLKNTKKPKNQKNNKKIKKIKKTKKTNKPKKTKKNQKKIKKKQKNQKNNSVGLLNLALCGRRVPEYCFFGFFGSLAISLVALLVSRALLPACRASAYGPTIAYFRVVCYFTTCCHVGSTIPLV